MKEKKESIFSAGMLVRFVNNETWHYGDLEDTFIVGNLDHTKSGFEVPLKSPALILHTNPEEEKIIVLVNSKVGWIWPEEAVEINESSGV